METIEDLISYINLIDLYNVEGIKCGDALYYPLKNLEKKQSLTFFETIKSITYSVMFDNVKIEFCGKPNTLFLFSNSYGRRYDHLNNYSEIVHLCDNYIFAKPGKREFRFHIGYIYILLKWMKQLKKVTSKLKLRLYIVSYLIKAYSDYQRIETDIDHSGNIIDNLVTFCDVHVIDCFITQQYNMQNKKTITLQHGIFTKYADSYPFKGSKSKHFLVANVFSQNEAILSGYKNNIIAVGLCSFVNKSISRTFSIPDIYTIGVFLDSEIYREGNISTLKIIAEYNRMYGKEILIKFHPSSLVKEYEKYLEEFSDCGVVDERTSVIEFCEKSDVVIARNSTTLIEALQYGVLTYIIYSEKQEGKMFQNIDILKFENPEELHNLIDLQTKGQMMKNLMDGRKLFCCEWDITEKYKSVFRELGIIIK